MEKVVLKTLLTNEHFATAVFTYIKDDFFENEYKQIWNIFSKVYSEHQIVPSTDILKYEVEQLQVKSQVKDNINSFIDEAFTSPVPDKVLPYLIPKTEAWGLERMVYNAIVNGIAEFDSDKKDFGKIHDELRKAISYSFDSSVGMSYFLDAEARFDEYNRTCAKILFNIKMLDEWTDGGYDAEGTLNLIMAISGGGKSIWLVNIATQALLQGKNVLYVTMELAEIKIHQRIDAKLFDLDISEIKHLQREDYLSKVNQLQLKSAGDIIVKQLPTGAATVLDIRHVLSELKLKKNWQPDVIIADYLGIMSSSKKSKNDNTYSSQKAIAEELRALGIESRIPVWSAVQYNRSGYGNSAGGLDSISDSMGVVFTADLVLSIFQNDELAEMNSVMVKSLKNRYGLVDVTTIIGLNKAKMSFYDIDDHSTADRLVSKYQDDLPPSEDTHKFNKGFKSNRSFDDLLLED